MTQRQGVRRRWAVAPHWIWLVPLGALLAACAAILTDPRPLQLLRNATFDQFQRWQPRPSSVGAVCIVDLDEESLRRLGQWPWPRTRLAELITDLDSLHAASVALDIVLSEPDRTSPSAVLRDERLPAVLAQALSALPDHDARLAQALAGSNVALGFLLTNERTRSPPPATGAVIHGTPRTGYLTIGPSPLPHLPTFAGEVPSLPSLREAARGEGAFTFVPDADGVVRRVPLFVNLAGAIAPSLAAEALRLAAHAHQYTLRTAPGDGGLVDVRVGRRRIPTNAHGELWVHYSRKGEMRYIPAWKVLAGAVSADEVRGRIVLVGTSAPGLMDLRFSPLGGTLAGVEVHAQAIEQVLAGQLLARPGWASAVEALLTLLGGLAVALVAMRSNAAVSAGSFVLAAALAWGAAWLAFTRGGMLFDPSDATLAWLAVFVPTTVARHVASERRQRWVRQAFARYVSPNLVDHLIAHPEALQLGGQRQVCSFVFTDLAGFTSLMETIDPTMAVGLLNGYLDRMIAIAFEHDGTLDRIVGDAVAIVFSAPLAQADHQARALRCALAMQRFAHDYVTALAAQGTAFCQTRIGVHTGEVTVGNFGGSTIFDYRALGDPVNTASRLEGANKQIGTLICVSAATLAGCPGAPARPIGRLQLAGRVEPVMAYEPLDPSASPIAGVGGGVGNGGFGGFGGGAEDAGGARDAGGGGGADYRHAYTLMTDRDPSALAAFERLAAIRTGDPLVQFHVRRLRAGACGNLIVLTEK